MSAVDDLVAILETPGVKGFDFETTVSRLYGREICTAQAAHEDGREAVAHVYGKPNDLKRILKALGETEGDVPAHFAIFEAETILMAGGKTPAGLQCTYVAARNSRGILPGNGVEPSWALKAVAKAELDEEVSKEERSRDWRLPLDAASTEYALQDARVARDIWLLYIMTDLAPGTAQRAGYDVIAQAIPAIATCNVTGLHFNEAAHRRLCLQYQDEALEHLKDMKRICGGAIENHGSSQQVGVWICEQLTFEKGCTPTRASLLLASMTGISWRLTASGSLSMDKKFVATILEELNHYFPVVVEYMIARSQYQKRRTILTSFGEGLRDKVDPDGRLRTTLIPHGAKTSRQTSKDPNLQNQPAEDVFRALYDAPENRVLVVCDYPQIELVCGCLMAPDETMQEVFRTGVDIHSATAIRVFGIPEDAFDIDNPDHAKKRKNGKPVTFASLYGAQASTIALNSGLPMGEAASLLDGWLGVYSGIANYRDTQPGIAAAAGHVNLVSGQTISVRKDTRPAQAINAPIQGSAASCMYRALTRVHDALNAAGLDARLALNVHDELLVESTPEAAPAAARIMEVEMREAVYDLFPEAKDLGVLERNCNAAVVSNWALKETGPSADEYELGLRLLA